LNATANFPSGSIVTRISIDAKWSRIPDCGFGTTPNTPPPPALPPAVAQSTMHPPYNYGTSSLAVSEIIPAPPCPNNRQPWGNISDAPAEIWSLIVTATADVSTTPNSTKEWTTQPMVLPAGNEPGFWNPVRRDPSGVLREWSLLNSRHYWSCEFPKNGKSWSAEESVLEK